MNHSQSSEQANKMLLLRLAHILDRIDPVPEPTFELASASYLLRSVNSEYAELVDDSATHPDRFAGVRGDRGVRMLYYETPDFGVELQVTEGDDGRSVLGQVVAGTATEIRAETMTRVETVKVDELGRFGFDNLPSGPFRIHVSGPSRPIVTDWTTL
jgi:hypothetical protein